MGASIWSPGSTVTLDSASLAALAASNSSSLIGHIASGTGAVATTVQAKLRESVSVFDFMTAAQIADVRARTLLVDVTAAIQAAINSLGANISIKSGQSVTAKFGRLKMPAGDYLITSGLLLTEGYRLILEGAGAAGARIVWRGTGGTAVKLTDCAGCLIQDIELYVDPSFTLNTGFESMQDTALVGIAPTGNKFVRLSVVGNEVTVDAYKIDYTVTDANNDFHEFDSCSAKGYTRAAAYLRGFQSHVNYFRNCDFNGGNLAFSARIGQYGIYTTSNLAAASASFVVDGGAIGWHSVADFHLIGGASNGFVIKNVSSENSDRLLTTTLVDAPCNVLLEGVRYASDGLNADGIMISYQLNGSLLISGCAFGTNGTTNAAQPIISIVSNNSIHCRVRGTHFSWRNSSSGANSTEFSPVVVTGSQAVYADVKLEGCSFENSSRPTQAGYLNHTGAGGTEFAMNGFYGDAAYRLAHTSATTLTHIRPGAPNQEIAVMMTNLNTTLKHNSGVAGDGQLFLKAGVDFTPPSAPYVVKFIWESGGGRWIQI